MSTEPDQQPEPELELARPARPTSNPHQPAVRSAARMAPIASARQQVTRERIQEGAVDTLLNSVSILGEVIEDFRNSDRFFKYKALVLTLWALLTVGAFGIACPRNGPSNDINAMLVVTSDGERPIYAVKNSSGDTWQDVEIIVNGGYRSTISQIEANGGMMTLSHSVIYDVDGKPAPSHHRITDIEVHVREPEETIVLLRNGEVVNQ